MAVSLADTLTSLERDEHISVAHVRRLSDLQGADLELFKERWPAFSDERRRIIARHMADLSEESYLADFDDILAFCLGDGNAAVRLAAVEGLLLSEDVKLLPKLLAMLAADEDEAVRAAAADTLGQFLYNALCAIIPPRFEEVIVPALLAQLDDPATPAPVWRQALEAFAIAGHERLPHYVQLAYESDDLQTQESAVRTMGLSGDSRWLPTIIEEMDSPSPAMRATAANAAGNLDEPSAVDPLANLLADEEDGVLLAAIEALGKIGGDRAHRLLSALRQRRDMKEWEEVIEEALEEIEAVNAGLGELTLFEFDPDEDDSLHEESPDWDED